MSAVLWTRSLAKTFRLHLQQGLSIPVLRDVEFEVRAGECVVLAGPSGAGKSTLMRCLYGNYGASHGEIWIRHKEADLELTGAAAQTVRDVRRLSLGYVSQFLRVIPRVATLDIVAEPIIAQGGTADRARRTARELLLRLNIPERLHDLPPATFSGGEQQRVNLARGFAPSFPVMLLDEPTASLDNRNRSVVVDLIRERLEAGTAIVGIFHDLDVRDRVADRLFEVLAVQDAA